MPPVYLQMQIQSVASKLSHNLQPALLLEPEFTSRSQVSRSTQLSLLSITILVNRYSIDGYLSSKVSPDRLKQDKFRIREKNSKIM